MADFEPGPHVPRGGATAAPAPRPALPADAFYGRAPGRVSRSEIEPWEGRLEYWGADTEMAWVAEPTVAPRGVK